MVSFKDKIEGRKVDFREVKEAAINSLDNGIKNGDTCKPSTNVVDYKSRFPGGVVPPGVIPPGGKPGDITTCCDKLDTIIDLLSKYKGGKYSSKVLKTQAATPVEIAFDITQPSPDPMTVGFYDDIDIHNNKTPPANAEVLWVICDGPVSPTDPFIYVRSSPDKKSFTQEIPVKIGEKWGFEEVYQLRVRSALLGTEYRASEYDNQLTYVSVAVSTTPIFSVTPNRHGFIDLNITVNMIDSILPSIIIPDGFALAVRSSVDNPFGTKIYTSSVDATIAGIRNTLLPGDVKEYQITNANLIHLAGSQNGLTVDISVEQ
jgi:hypothetical protein